MMGFEQMITTFGFPIAMVIYFVTRFEKILNNNTKALGNLKETIAYCKRRS